jgi:hypothetical protein
VKKRYNKKIASAFFLPACQPGQSPDRLTGLDKVLAKQKNKVKEKKIAKKEKTFCSFCQILKI